MQVWTPALWLVVLTAVLTACAPSAPTQPAANPGQPAGQPAPPAAPRQSKTLTVTLQGEPSVLHILMGGDVGGSPAAEVSLALHQRLSTFDHKGVPFAQLATELPSFDKQTWVVKPDGTMQTTYRLRPNIKWHDGQPMTARDVVFGWKVARDRELPVATREVADLVTQIDTPDEATLVLHWSRSYPLANALGEIEMAPLPVHLLEETFNADKEKFQRLPYWGTEFIGVGPYYLEKWEIGSHFQLKAFEGFYSTRPKIDNLIFRFISDENTTIANLYSGVVDGSFRGLDLSKVLQIKAEWERAGKKPMVVIEAVGSRGLEVQYRDPRPRELADVRVRRGLLHAIDRQSIVDTTFSGHTVIADSMVTPDDPKYAWVKDATAKYPYDQRRALELLAEVGWRRGSDGNVVNAAGERVSLHLITAAGGQWESIQAINADNWRSIGLAVEEAVIPTARARDRELLTQFPNFNGAFFGLNYLQPVRLLMSSECAVPDNRWVGTNRGCYKDPEIDRVSSALLTAVEPAQQQRLWPELMRLHTEQLPMIPLTHVAQPTLFREGVTGLKGASWRGGSSSTWNVTEWDIS
jgi:peptide/nickel transport system substrate-binding protein